MEETLQAFVHALRRAEVRVSTAETLDAAQVMHLVGYADREGLRQALRLTLPKTAQEKARFDECFERFFTVDAGAPARTRAGADAGTSEAETGDPQQGASESAASRGDAAPASAPGGGGAGTGAGVRDEGDESGPEDRRRSDDEAGSLPPGVPLPEASSPLGRLLLGDSPGDVAAALADAAERVRLREIVVFTQRGVYTRRILDAMGLRALDEEIAERGAGGTVADRLLGRALRQAREALRERVRDHVERAFLLHADRDGRELRESLLRRVKLSNVERRSYADLGRIVERMAKRLAATQSKRRRVAKRGQLDVSRTLRANMAFDATPFRLKWKAERIDRPRVFAICDVSGSVAAYARFMLMFLYAMEAVLPRVRAFAFSSDLGEVTELFRRLDVEDAMAHTLRDFGGGATDYGQAFEDFRRLCLDDVDKRSTVIILGDARNNYGDPRTDRLKELYDRSRRVLWLNPEPETTWGVGDSEIQRYRAYCHHLRVCNTLAHLERLVGDLVHWSR